MIRTLLRTVLLFHMAAGLAAAQPVVPEAERALAVVTAFHDALRLGDAEAAKRLLADDAVVLEGGHRDSREEYLARHADGWRIRAIRGSSRAVR